MKLFKNPFIRGILKSIPILGEVVTNVDNENASKKGSVDWAEVVQAIVRLIIVIAILKGVLSSDAAESIIDVIK